MIDSERGSEGVRWLILSDERYLRGGAQSATRELARAAVDDGALVEILCLQENPYTQLELLAPRCTVTRIDRVEPRSLRLASLRTAWTILKRARPDVLLFNNTGTPNFLAFMALAGLAGVKHRVVMFGSELALPAQSPGRGHLGGLLPSFSLWRRELLWSCHLSYRTMTLGLFNHLEQMREWQAAFGYPPEVCTQWNLPVDLSRFKPSPQVRRQMRHELDIGDDEWIIGGVGALNHHKEFETAIRALAHMRGHRPQTRLVIAGEGPRRDALTRLSHDLGLGAHVRLLGERDDIPQLMNAFDVYCMPSREETLGIAFLEAQATGVPIVVPDLPGPRRIASNGASGLIAEGGTPEAFAAAWERLATDSVLRTRLIQNGFKSVTAFDRSGAYAWLRDRLASNPRGASVPIAGPSVETPA